MPSSCFLFEIVIQYYTSALMGFMFFFHYSNQKSSILFQGVGADLKWMNKVIRLSPFQCCVLRNGLFLRCNQCISVVTHFNMQTVRLGKFFCNLVFTEMQTN